MKVVELFPKPKRVIGWDEHGRRTAHSLKQDQAWHDKHGLEKGPSWDEMQADIWTCTFPYELRRRRWYWSNVAERDKWPQHHIELALDEFDKAEKAIEAWSAYQTD